MAKPLTNVNLWNRLFRKKVRKDIWWTMQGYHFLPNPLNPGDLRVGSIIVSLDNPKELNPGEEYQFENYDGKYHSIGHHNCDPLVRVERMRGRQRTHIYTVPRGYTTNINGVLESEIVAAVKASKSVQDLFKARGSKGTVFFVTGMKLAMGPSGEPDDESDDESSNAPSTYTVVMTEECQGLVESEINMDGKLYGASLYRVRCKRPWLGGEMVLKCEKYYGGKYIYQPKSGVCKRVMAVWQSGWKALSGGLRRCVLAGE